MKQQLAQIALIVFCYIVFSPAHAQQLDSRQVKSAFVYNFIKHIEWPNKDNSVPYIIAVYQDDNLYNTIYTNINNRAIKESRISVVAVDSINEARKANIVFLTSRHNQNISKIAADLRRSNTLLITNNSVDKHNVMINLLYESESSLISFEVNKSNIIYEQLKMSAELLLLGGSELDVATLYRETEVAMQSMKEREQTLQTQLISQEQHLRDTAVKLERLNKNLIERESIAIKRQKELAALKTDIDQQRFALTAKEQQLISMVEQLEQVEQNLLNQQGSVNEKELQNKEMAQRIAENKLILEQQQERLEKSNLEISQKNEEIAARNQKIDQQALYIVSMTVFIIIALVVSLLVVVLFIQNKKTTAKLSKTLSNLKDTQEQLIQSEKLASLGSLTAGVAHEINTPLGIAVTSTSAALDQTIEIKDKIAQGKISKSMMTRYIAAIEESASLNNRSLERVIDLLSNFKQVAADQVVEEIRSLDLVAYIDEVMSTLSAEMKKHRVEYQYTGIEEIEVVTFPGAIAQVLTNLVTNSLRHGFIDRNSGNIAINITAGSDDTIEIIYRDDGIGMSKEILHNIFEPFFTTKRNAGGTGLGMNIVFNIINQKLAGHIEVSSQPNIGTEFTITLPTKLSIEE